MSEDLKDLFKPLIESIENDTSINEQTDIGDNYEGSVDYHIGKINEKYRSHTTTFYELVDTIVESWSKLNFKENDPTQKELSRGLDMSPSHFSKYLSIGRSPLIKRNRDTLPSTINGLYQFSKLEKLYSQIHGVTEGMDQCSELIGTKIVSKTGSKEIRELYDDLDKSTKRQQRIQKKVGDNSFSDETGVTNLEDILEEKTLYNTLIINPPNNLISKWTDSLVKHIREEYPYHDLTGPSGTGTSIKCLVKIPSDKINIGIKLLEVIGCPYKDIFIPKQPKDGLKKLKKDYVVIKGEKGSSPCPEENSHNISSTDIDHIMDYCETVYNGPYISIFDDHEREGWKCLIQ